MRGTPYSQAQSLFGAERREEVAGGWQAFSEFRCQTVGALGGGRGGGGGSFVDL